MVVVVYNLKEELIRFGGRMVGRKRKEIEKLLFVVLFEFFKLESSCIFERGLRIFRRRYRVSLRGGWSELNIIN